MMTIEEEVQALIIFLSHPAGFDVDLGGMLCIRPICESSPPDLWEVDWTENHFAEVSAACPYEYAKEFSSLQAAAQFFVEKRRYLCYGLDFEVVLVGMMSNTKGKNNTFFFSPGSYGPHSSLDFWAEHIEAEGEEGTEEYDDNLYEAQCDYANEADVDHGCYFITRERALQLLEQLKKLLKE
jgi:hypothetical protein